MPKKILVIAPSWVGDMVMAQTLLRLLKQQDATVIIDVLAPAWTFSILKCMPEVSAAIEMPVGHGQLNLRERYKLGKSLRQHKYDQAIILPNTFKSALIPWFAKIPVRTGWVGEWRYLLLNDARRLDKTKYKLMIEQYMALGLPKDAALPIYYPYPLFDISEAAQQAVLNKHHIQLTNKPIIALCAGAEFGSSKRWPAEYYAEIAKQKIKEGYRIWLFGSPKDKPVTDSIMQLTDHQCENFAGQFELSETITMLSLIVGMVTNDSGLMHVASALKKPLIAIYGSTSPDFTPPLSSTSTILKLHLDCQPCFQRECPLKHHRCMLDIKPEQVLAIMAEWGKA
jgi:heptosyltransferase-2